jgi:hypothetical protein
MVRPEGGAERQDRDRTARAAERRERRRDRRPGRHHVVDEDERPVAGRYRARSQERARDVGRPIDGLEPGLGCRGSLPREERTDRTTETRGDLARQQGALVEAALALARRVEGDGNEDEITSQRSTRGTCEEVAEPRGELTEPLVLEGVDEVEERGGRFEGGHTCDPSGSQLRRPLRPAEGRGAGSAEEPERQRHRPDERAPEAAVLERGVGTQPEGCRAGFRELGTASTASAWEERCGDVFQRDEPPSGGGSSESDCRRGWAGPNGHRDRSFRERCVLDPERALHGLERRREAGPQRECRRTLMDEEPATISGAQAACLCVTHEERARGRVDRIQDHQ